jgi:hypothetical protein
MDAVLITAAGVGLFGSGFAGLGLLRRRSRDLSASYVDERFCPLVARGQSRDGKRGSYSPRNRTRPAHKPVIALRLATCPVMSGLPMPQPAMRACRCSSS